MKEGLRLYTLDNLEQHNSELEKMGVQLYVMESWELFVYILQNYERLHSSNGSAQPWFSFCQAGEWRSKHFNLFLKEIGIPLGRKKRDDIDFDKDGAIFKILLSTLPQGEARNGIVRPSNFKEGFQNLVIFVSAKEIRAEYAQRLMTDSLTELLRDDPEQDVRGLRIFIVTEDDTQISGLSRVVLDLLTQMEGDEDPRSSIANTIQEKYSPIVDTRWADLEEKVEET